MVGTWNRFHHGPALLLGSDVTKWGDVARFLLIMCTIKWYLWSIYFPSMCPLPLGGEVGKVLKRSPTSEPVRHPWNDKRRKWSRLNPEHLCHGGWNWTSDQPRLRVLRSFDHRWCLESTRYQINSPLLVVAENNTNFKNIAIEMMVGDNFIRMSNAWQWLASEVKTLAIFYKCHVCNIFEFAGQMICR